MHISYRNILGNKEKNSCLHDLQFEAEAQGPVPQSLIKLTLDRCKILIAISLPLKKGFNKILVPKGYKLCFLKP